MLDRKVFKSKLQNQVTFSIFVANKVVSPLHTTKQKQDEPSLFSSYKRCFVAFLLCLWAPFFQVYWCKSGIYRTKFKQHVIEVQCFNLQNVKLQNAIMGVYSENNKLK